MRIRQVVILVALILIVTILTGYYLNLVSIYYLVPVVFVFLLITILGSINICWNYFFVSHCHRNTNEKVIAITFDDGPDPVKTPELLTVLDKHQVNVAFFLIGNKVNANKQLVVNINQKGHVIGNHSYTHSNYFDLSMLIE